MFISPVLHQSFVLPVEPGNPVLQSAPQLHIDVHVQLFGVVVSGSATSFALSVISSRFMPIDSPYFWLANGQAASMQKYQNHYSISYIFILKDYWQWLGI